MRRVPGHRRLRKDTHGLQPAGARAEHAGGQEQQEYRGDSEESLQADVSTAPKDGPTERRRHREAEDRARGAGQPDGEAAWVRSPHRNRTVSAPSRKTPVKASTPMVQSRWLAWASSILRWTSPFTARACCCIQYPCQVRTVTATRTTARPITSGPRSRSGPDMAVTSTPRATLASTPSKPPRVAYR